MELVEHFKLQLHRLQWKELFFNHYCFIPFSSFFLLQVAIGIKVFH